MRYKPAMLMVTILMLLLIAIPSINSVRSSSQQESVISNQGTILVLDNFANTIFFEYGAESGVLQPPWDGVSPTVGDTGVTVSNEQVRTGTSAMKMYVEDFSVKDRAQVGRWSDDPADHADAYFSAWFYFPTGFSITEWRNIFQWKDNNINEDPPGKIMFAIFLLTDMEFRLYLKGLYQPDIADDSDTVVKLTDKITDILDQWVHIQVHIVRGSAYKVKDGTIQIWINNVLRYDNNAIATHPMYTTILDYQWGVGNYGGPANPDDQTLYVDDVVASSEKVPESYEVIDK